MNTQPTTEHHPTHRTMAGSATLMCLLSLCVLLSFGTATLTMLLAKQSVVKRATEVDEAFMAAEAAVDLALSELRTNVDYGGDGFGVVTGNAGRATFTATLDRVFAGPGQYTIVATGSVSGISRSVEVAVAPVSGAVFGRRLTRPSGSTARKV
jgi:hypothetical protein